MPEMAVPDYAEYRAQLARLPGGPAAALRDFFAPCLAGAEQFNAQNLPCWPLREGGRLCLHQTAGGVRLVREDAGQTLEVARFGEDLLSVAQDEPPISPLVLALLAIAAGDVDDGHRLKQLLPKVDAAARDLMLMTLCRLCG